MPRKKPAAATASTTTPSKGAVPSVSGATVATEEVDDGISNYELPKSIVARIAKASVSGDIKLQKEIPLALVKGSTVFINYLTALAHDAAGERGHKTIAAVHVMDAVKQLGWEDSPELVKLLTSELKVFRAAAEAKKLKPKIPGTFPGRPTSNVGGGGGVLPSVLLPVPGTTTSAPPQSKGKKSTTTSITGGEEGGDEYVDESNNPQIRKVTDDRAGDGDDDFYKDGEEEEFIEEEEEEEDDDVEDEEEEEEEEAEEEEEEELPGLKDEEMREASDED